MAGIWYRAGTISVTNGSKKITGFGTLWKTSALKPDKGHAFHGADGRIYELDYVESDTVLYLVTAYLGPTATGQAYAIDVTRTSTIPALSREISAFSAYAQGQYDSWQKVLTGTGMVTLTAPDGQQVQVPALSAFQPTSASLKALQALTPAADRFGYFTDVNAAASTPLTPFARSLLDDVDAPSMLSTLGAIGSIGTIINQDWNAILTPGVYVVSNATGPNSPSVYRYGVLLVLRPVSTVVEQIYFPHRTNNGPVMRRQSYDSGATWPEGWDGILSRKTILGIVSQSGGSPTGSVIERGSNANGEYIKFADGTMLTFTRVTFDFSVLAQNNYGTSYMLYPATFISPPSVSISRVQTIYNAVNIRWVSQVSLSSESGRFIAYCIDSTGLSTSGGTCDYIFAATGRWM